MADKSNFIVVKYPKPDTAEAALAAVTGLAKEKVIKLGDAVAMTRTDKGKLKLHQTKDGSAAKGMIKGGAIGVILALLFGPAAWIAAGVGVGAAFGLMDKGIKNKLLKELGTNMTSDQSALAVLVEEADWATALNKMAEHKFGGEVVVKELVGDAAEEIEKFMASRTTTEPVPEEVTVAASPS